MSWKLDEQKVFVGVALVFLLPLLYVLCKSGDGVSATVFIVALVVVAGVYLFKFSNLGSFAFSSPLATANFVKEKKEQVQRDATDIKEAKDRILSLEQHLKEVAEQAAPPTLLLEWSKTEPTENGYRVEVQFVPSKNVPLGQLVFNATADEVSNARIVDFRPCVGLFFHSGTPSQITEDGRHAILVFVIPTAGRLGIALIVSDKCRLAIGGNYLSEPVEVQVE